MAKLSSGNKKLTDLERKRNQALEMFLDTWDAALTKGLSSDLLASVAIFAALTDMIENHGEEFTAEMAAGLAARIREGEFTLKDSGF